MKLRRTITTLAVGLAATGALALTAPVASAAPATPPQDKPIKLVDHCDKKDWDKVAPGLCNVQAGGTTLAQFGAALAQGGDGNWWINNRNLTIHEGDTLVVDNIGGEFHTFTHVNQFGRGFGFFDAALPPTTEKDFDPATAPADANLAAVGPTDALRRVGGLTAGTYRFQCLIHPWMRTTVTVTKS